MERLLDEAGLGAGPLVVEPIGEGHSNLTFLLRRGADAYVLRRPPLPPIPPSAHDVLREARVLRSLAGSAVPVPEILLEVAETDVIGAPFYVMTHVDGFVPTASLPRALDTPQERSRVGQAVVSTLAALHAVDPPQTFGRPSGYLQRQVQRFGGLWELSKTRELPAVDAATRLLAAGLPASGAATIVHGDYRLGNLLLADDAPARVNAILDWEMATIGDPLADVGYLTATWVEPGYSPGPLALSSVTALPGFPDRDELTAAYEELTGRQVSNVHWYRALALWKGAIFLEGNYRRWRDGASHDDYYASIRDQIPVLAELALEELRDV